MRPRSDSVSRCPVPAWSPTQMTSGALVCPLKLVAPTAFAYYRRGLPEAVERPKIALFRSLRVAEAATTATFMLSIGEPALAPVGK
jgi:hypothetical protein